MALTLITTPDPAPRFTGRITLSPAGPPTGIRKFRKPGSVTRQLADPRRAKR